MILKNHILPLIRQVHIRFGVNQIPITEGKNSHDLKSGVCKYSRDNIGATGVTGIGYVASNEDALTNAIATVGPISVAICVMSSFYTYSSGGLGLAVNS